jgi:hypothetical protein
MEIEMEGKNMGRFKFTNHSMVPVRDAPSATGRHWHSSSPAVEVST